VGEVLVVLTVPGRPGRARGEHPRLVGEVGERELVAFRQRMSLPQNGRHRLAQNHLGLEVPDQRWAAETGVEAALAKARNRGCDVTSSVRRVTSG
jgi:hypothetical protein